MFAFPAPFPGVGADGDRSPVEWKKTLVDSFFSTSDQVASFLSTMNSPALNEDFAISDFSLKYVSPLKLLKRF